MEPDISMAELKIYLESSWVGCENLHKSCMRVGDTVHDTPQDINFRNLLALSEDGNLIDRFSGDFFFVERKRVAE